MLKLWFYRRLLKLIDNAKWAVVEANEAEAIKYGEEMLVDTMSTLTTPEETCVGAALLSGYLTGKTWKQREMMATKRASQEFRDYQRALNLSFQAGKEWAEFDRRHT